MDADPPDRGGRESLLAQARERIARSRALIAHSRHLQALTMELILETRAQAAQRRALWDAAPAGAVADDRFP